MLRLYRDRRLWTATLVVETKDVISQVFDATVAGTRAEAEARLRRRYGLLVGGDVELMCGFDSTQPLAEALLSPAATDMLRQVAADPNSPLARGLSISVEQQFASDCGA